MFLASLNNVTAQYGSQKVLKGVSFEIQAGERLGLIGANGSGKTTMLRILLGEDVPSEGSVNIAGGTRIARGHCIEKLVDRALSRPGGRSESARRQGGSSPVHKIASRSMLGDRECAGAASVEAG